MHQRSAQCKSKGAHTAAQAAALGASKHCSVKQKTDRQTAQMLTCRCSVLETRIYTKPPKAVKSL